MIPWNNVYLVPIVLVGGLIAFFFGRTIVGGLIRVWGRWTAHKPAAVTPPPAYAAPEAAWQPQPIWPAPRQPSLADRKEELAVEFLRSEDEQIALENRLRAQDEEEARRIRLMDEARKRNRSNNVLVGKLDVPVNAGPMTTHIALTEDYLKTLKAAAASRDAAKP